MRKERKLTPYQEAWLRNSVARSYMRPFGLSAVARGLFRITRLSLACGGLLACGLTSLIIYLVLVFKAR